MDYSKIKIDNILYECEYGTNIETRVISDPEKRECEVFGESRIQWCWAAVNIHTDEVINYLVTEGLEHYGPRLYDEPQYVRFINGRAVFKMLGQKT